MVFFHKIIQLQRQPYYRFASFFCPVSISRSVLFQRSYKDSLALSWRVMPRLFNTLSYPTLTRIDPNANPDPKCIDIINITAAILHDE